MSSRAGGSRPWPKTSSYSSSVATAALAAEGGTGTAHASTGAKAVKACRRYASGGQHAAAAAEVVAVVPVPFLSATPTPETEDEGAGTTVAQRMMAFFDPRGILTTQAPRNWALAACRFHPFHHTRELADGPSSLSKRRQELNARSTLVSAQRRLEDRLKLDSVSHLGKTHEVDAQEARYLRLLFEPLQSLPEQMAHQLLKELREDEGSIGAVDVEAAGVGCAAGALCRPRRRRSSGRGASGGGRMGRGERRLPGEPDVEPVGQSRRMSNERWGGRPLLKGSNHKILLAIHQHYTSRVTGTETAELMTRSTWFRFLHHCGLLGPEGGVNFAQAAAIFDTFAEAEAEACEGKVEGADGELGLGFGCWVAAVHHLLLSQASGRQEAEADISKFFDVSIKQCRERLRLGGPLLSTPATPSRGRSTTPRTSSTVTTRSAGLLAWQVALAEERMCEPEVLRLAQEFGPALQRLFRHYAEQGKIPSEIGSQSDLSQSGLSDSEGEEPLPAPAAPGAASVTAAGSGQGLPLAERPAALKRPGGPGGHMSPAALQALLRDLGLFPDIVQIHSLRQHLHISQMRDGVIELAYPTFVECLLRMAFVYLGVYGNDVQQAAPSKWKCLWLFGLLSARCQAFGDRLGLPRELFDAGASSGSRDGGARAEEGSGAAGRLWQREPCDLDSMPLEQLTLWRTLDAEIAEAPPRTPLTASPVPLSSRPTTVQSLRRSNF